MRIYRPIAHARAAKPDDLIEALNAFDAAVANTGEGHALSPILKFLKEHATGNAFVDLARFTVEDKEANRGTQDALAVLKRLQDELPAKLGDGYSTHAAVSYFAEIIQASDKVKNVKTPQGRKSKLGKDQAAEYNTLKQEHADRVQMTILEQATRTASYRLATTIEFLTGEGLKVKRGKDGEEGTLCETDADGVGAPLPEASPSANFVMGQKDSLGARNVKEHIIGLNKLLKFLRFALLGRIASEQLDTVDLSPHVVEIRSLCDFNTDQLKMRDFPKATYSELIVEPTKKMLTSLIEKAKLACSQCIAPYISGKSTGGSAPGSFRPSPVNTQVLRTKMKLADYDQRELDLGLAILDFRFVAQQIQDLGEDMHADIARNGCMHSRPLVKLPSDGESWVLQTLGFYPSLLKDIQAEAQALLAKCEAAETKEPETEVSADVLNCITKARSLLSKLTAVADEKAYMKLMRHARGGAAHVAETQKSLEKHLEPLNGKGLNSSTSQHYKQISAVALKLKAEVYTYAILAQLRNESINEDDALKEALSTIIAGVRAEVHSPSDPNCKMIVGDSTLKIDETSDIVLVPISEDFGMPVKNSIATTTLGEYISYISVFVFLICLTTN
jgi:hypothetical protein